jgi:hypothetical protein
MLAYYVSGSGLGSSLGSSSLDHQAMAQTLLEEARQRISASQNWEWPTTCASAIRDLQRASYALGAASAHITSMDGFAKSSEFILLLDYQRILKLAWSGKNGVKRRCRLK